MTDDIKDADVTDVVSQRSESDSMVELGWVTGELLVRVREQGGGSLPAGPRVFQVPRAYEVLPRLATREVSPEVRRRAGVLVAKMRAQRSSLPHDTPASALGLRVAPN